jgi:hypothetical protein
MPTAIVCHSQIRLIEHLARHGYKQCPNTPCLFCHRTRDIIFSLVVDELTTWKKH